MYYVIHNSDGDTHVEELDSQTLKARLDEKYYGEDTDFLRTIVSSDTNYWGEKLMIIKGSIVVPKPVQTVTEYEI